MNDSYLATDFGVVTGAGVDYDSCITAAQTALDINQQIQLDSENSFNVVFLEDDILSSFEADSKLGLDFDRIDSKYLRMLALASIAWKNCHPDQPEENQDQNQLEPLMLGLPHEPPNRPKEEKSEFIDWLYRDSGKAFDKENSLIFPYGRASGLMALHSGIKLLNQGEYQSVWVGAVDSYCDERLLHSHKESWQGPEPLSTLGEGAIFFRLSNINDGSQEGLHILAVEYGSQSSLIGQDDQFSDLALGLSLQRLTHCLEEENAIQQVFPPYTGNQDSMNEWGIASYGLNPYLDPEHHSQYPAIFGGDVGACDGLLKILLCEGGEPQTSVIISHSNNLHRVTALVKKK